MAEEWIDMSAHFPLEGFQTFTESLGIVSHAELVGTLGERLLVNRRPEGTVDLTLSGWKDDPDVSVFGLDVEGWDCVGLEASKTDDEISMPTTERDRRRSELGRQ